MDAPPPSPDVAAGARFDIVDVVRGIAILAMISYHFAWDLSYLQLIATNIVAEPAWQWYARSIAGSFLALSGFGLALAHARGLRRAAFLRRLAKIGGAALAVTLVSYVAFPESYIFFGILHCIAVSSVLALPFLKAPLPLTVAAAILVLLAPHWLTHPALDHPLLDWLGLGQSVPATNDYVPIFPWFGLVLLGLAAGRLATARVATLKAARWHASSPFTRLLALAGRKSLPIYLIHQLVLLGALYGVLQITGPNPAALVRPFAAQCKANCIGAGGAQALCRATCDCVGQRLDSDGLLRDVLADRVTAAGQTRIDGLVQECLFAAPRAP
jgi:uncharacterized membrane protein